MTDSAEQQIPGSWARCKLLFKSQGAHIALFVTVNVVFGALGILAPISIEYAATLSFVPALQKQLNAAGAYTFAIAYLASSISYVAVEYLDLDEVAKYRRPKVLLSAFAALIMIFCAVFSGSQTARSLVEDPRSTQLTANSASGQLELRPTEGAAAATPTRSDKPSTSNRRSLDSLDYLQIATTVLAVLVGLILFLVFQYQAPNMQAQLGTYEKKTEVDAVTLMTGLEVGRAEKP